MPMERGNWIVQVRLKTPLEIRIWLDFDIDKEPEKWKRVLKDMICQHSHNLVYDIHKEKIEWQKSLVPGPSMSGE